ncbi:TraR/DksA family transcriptional regulator [Pseudonocardia lacus]|uniref:TraR/DksA family transcriptional regulator n=1 Tax=Pseudonocardia lacus TaxID=2835865 RepID=UPI0027E31722|nr:TraR/DksA C4-type zinc finger protein [Pseudonocardia lacus]
MSEGSNVRESLAAERAATVEGIAGLQRQLGWLAEDQALASHDDEHDPDGVTVSVQRAQLQGLLAGARRDLAALDRALERLAAGTYGRCLSCGAAIGAARLEALPAAETCIACAGSPRRTVRRPRS